MTQKRPPRSGRLLSYMPGARLIATAVCLAWLQCHAADGFGQLGDDDIREAMTDLQLAMSVYDTAKKEVDGGWRRIDWRNDADGFKAAVYQRTLADGRLDRRVVFSGTDDLADWLTNLEQGGGWVIGLRRSHVDPLGNDQYRKALEYAKLFVEAKDKDPRMTLAFSGHSLGGALAQYCSLQLGVRATAFNSAALHQKVLDLAPSAKMNAETLISQFFLDQDPVHRYTTSFPGARQFGRQYLVTTPADLAPGLAANPAAGHGLEAMSLAIDRVLMRRQGSIHERARTLQERAADAARIDATISQRYAVPQEAAEAWATSVSAFANALDGMKTLTAFDRTRPPGSDELMTRLFKTPSADYMWWLGKAQFAYGLAQAIQQDREQFRGQSVVLLRSHTMEQLAEFGLDKLLPHFYEALSDRRYIKFQPRISLTGVTHEIGAPTFGVIDAMRAASRYGQLGHADVDTITQGLDALVGATWAALGLVVSGGNMKIAEIYQQAGQAAAQSLRYATAQLGADKAVLRFFDKEYRSQADVMIDMYRYAQQRAALMGSRVQSPTEFFGGDLEESLKNLDFTGRQRQELNDAYKSVASLPMFTPTTISAGASAQTPQQSVQDMQIAARLAPASGKVVVFGSGPLAEVAYREAAARVGSVNAKLEPASSSRLQRNAVAAAFGANTIINVSHERYRDVTAGGIRRRVEFDPVVNRPVQPPGRSLAPPPVATQPEPRTPPPPASLPRVGGVLLQGVAQSDTPGVALSSGNFSLIFQGEAGEISVPTLRRFVTAAWATYFTAHGPGISIEPLPGLKDRHVVRYIGHVVNSDLGRVMREVDYIMKSWAVGDSHADLDDFLNPDQFAARNRRVHVGVPSRFWFVTDAMNYRTAGDTLLLGDARLALRTQYLHRTEGTSNPENEAFAEQFTTRYGEVASRYPVFDELREYAKMVALAKHLKERGVPMLAWLLSNREMVLTEDSPGTVAAFARRSDYFEGVHIEGGVDLSTTAQASSYVPDATLLQALTRAPFLSPGGDAGTRVIGPASVDITSGTGQDLTVASSREITVSAPQSSGERFATDLGLQMGGIPKLEIARFRRAGVEGSGEFGADWHMLIPYSVHPASAERTRYSNALVPKTMIVRNELTGREETLSFDTQRYGVAGYVPERIDTSVNIGLFILSDASFELRDKLGSAFRFDAAGRLTEMSLAPDYRVRYEYDEQRQNWRNFTVLPYRLASEGHDRVQAAGASMPKTMRLHDAQSRSEQLLEFDPNDAEGRVGYRPVGSHGNNEQFLAVRTDGSFLLHKDSGTTITFDPSGSFTAATKLILKSISQGDYDVHFDHQLGIHGYRVHKARVVDRTKSAELYAVNYSYDRQGELARVQVSGPGAVVPPAQVVNR